MTKTNTQRAVNPDAVKEARNRDKTNAIRYFTVCHRDSNAEDACLPPQEHLLAATIPLRMPHHCK
jgi:hypothetical protein